MNRFGATGIPGVMVPGASGGNDSTSAFSKNASMIILVVLVGLFVWFLLKRKTQATLKDSTAPTAAVASLSTPVYYPPQPPTYYAHPAPSYAPQPQMWYPPPYQQQAYPPPPTIARG